jgi:uncharacterized protein YbaP (TraB family)
MEKILTGIIRDAKPVNAYLQVNPWQIVSFVNNKPVWHKSKLRPDFIITVRFADNSESKVVVEMDGIQHFVPVNFGGNAHPDELHRKLLSSKKRDALKEALCENHNMHLLRLSHSVKYSDHKGLLRDFLDQVAVRHANKQRLVWRIGAEYQQPTP